MIQIANILFDLGSSDFLVPYLRRELTPDFDPEKPEPEQAPVAAVRIFRTDERPQADTRFEALCREQSLPVATLRCPNIVGTGMQGLPRRIAEGIYKGTFFHISGSEGRTSVVHAVDVARAAALAAGSNGDYVLTDGTSPTIHDLAEALAYRIDNKRIFSLPARLCRWWYSRDFFRLLTSDTSEVETFTTAFPGFLPVDTLNYLRTHIYDDASL